MNSDAKTHQCGALVGELDTMKAAAKMLDSLPLGPVRRILSWLADRYGFALVSMDDGATLRLDRDTEPMPHIERNPVQVVPWTSSNQDQPVCGARGSWASE